ncbi:hypothetical protein EUGRSUZ_L00416 [Eucalyptus grandis]|uniref:Uncharacterized protein n=1 Tax=Eucalyptus grandis TaxID=71139 RepID=A0A058ZWE7_EUCGR|nr:hypothetical protein EUGRSUZ_L00416 [Eucalyptus grandis]
MHSKLFRSMTSTLQYAVKSSIYVCRSPKLKCQSISFSGHGLKQWHEILVSPTKANNTIYQLFLSKQFGGVIRDNKFPFSPT